jgi:outer membrane protein OmpA-like peptidoglycan-associated protein
MIFRSLKNKDNKAILMVRGFVFIVFGLISLFVSNDTFAFENIKLKVVVINSFDGNQLQSNFDIKVTLDPSGQVVKLTSNKKESYYEVSRGQVIKVSVTAVGFYTEQKVVETENLNDGDVIEVQMNPKPSGKLVLTTVDSETKDPVVADVEIVYFSRINKEKINEQNTQINYFYEMKGKYKITTNANGYLKDYREIDLDISANQKTENLIIELVKNRMKQEVSLFDVSTNGKISSGTAAITHDETGQKIFEGKIENGIIQFDGNRNDNYTLTTKVNGFSDLKSPFLLDGKPKKYGLTPNSTLQIEIFDEESNQRLGVDLEIISPSGKKFKAIKTNKESYNFTPTETGTYTIESKAAGYINRSGNFSIKSLTAGNTFYTLRLKKGSNEYVINVFDYETKNPINNALVKVFNEQSREIQGKANKNQKTVNLDAEKKHFYEVSAAGYNDYTANVGFDKSIQVFLKKKLADSLITVEIKVIDEQTRLSIKDARLRVFEDNVKALALSFDPSISSFVSNKINPKLSYSYELSAKGYNNLRQTLALNDRKIELVMTAFEISNFYFSAFDAFTKEKIDADFGIKVGQVPIKQDIEEGKVKVSLSGTNNYNLDVQKDNYKGVSKLLDKREAENDEFKIGLFRESYPILFKLNNKVEAENISGVKATIRNKVDNKSENLIYDESKNGFSGNISPEGNYFIEINMNGFENFTGAFVLKQANPEKLEYGLTLKPIKKVAEKVIPEKPIAKVEESKVKSEVAKQTEVRPIESPKPALDIKKGVKYPLEGVNFEKSKTVLVKGAEVKLDGVVDYLKQNPKAQIEVAGHTDNEGSDQRLNQRLSEFRAKVVANYLFNKGISPDRIITVGKGSSEPIVPNDTDENKSKNRRIEILILED